MSDNYVLTKSSKAFFFVVQISKLSNFIGHAACHCPSKQFSDVKKFCLFALLCCGKGCKNMDRDECYFLQLNNADNLHEELYFFLGPQRVVRVEAKFHVSCCFKVNAHNACPIPHIYS